MVATIIFVTTYILISLGENSPRKLDRPTVSLLGAVLMVMTGVLTREASAAAIDFRTLAVLFGMMVLLAVLTQSGLPGWLAGRVLRRCQSPHMLLALVVYGAGIGSAIMLNDTVCLLATPLLVEMARQARVPAVPFLLALATGSNIGSVMTLTGNPQNIIIGHASGWGWADFLMVMGPVGIVCLTVDWLLLELIFCKVLREGRTIWATREDESGEGTPAIDRALAFKSVVVFTGLTVTFLLGAPLDFAAVAAATILLVWADRPPRLALEAVDWSLLLFFAGLFVVVEGFVRANGAWLDRVLAGADRTGSLGSLLELGVLSVVGSNLFSNVPFVLIIAKWVPGLGEPRFVWLLLALTSTFAGNLTLFGSVANIIVAQGAQRQAPLGFADFLRAGLPVTVITTLLGVMLLWFFNMRGWLQ